MTTISLTNEHSPASLPHSSPSMEENEEVLPEGCISPLEEIEQKLNLKFSM